jgi:hypothetical protein
VRAALGVVGISGIVGALAIILTRTPSTMPSVDDDQTVEVRDTIAGTVAACTQLYAGDTAGAIAAAERLFGDLGPRAQGAAAVTADEVLAQLAPMCNALQRMRDDCTSGKTTGQPERDAGQREACEHYKATLDALPVHAIPPASTAGSGR